MLAQLAQAETAAFPPGPASFDARLAVARAASTTRHDVVLFRLFEACDWLMAAPAKNKTAHRLRVLRLVDSDTTPDKWNLVYMVRQGSEKADYERLLCELGRAGLRANLPRFDFTFEGATTEAEMLASVCLSQQRPALALAAMPQTRKGKKQQR